jgi:hypothetical protein
MANLGDHVLKQIDTAWLARQPEDVLRSLAGRQLENCRSHGSA